MRVPAAVRWLAVAVVAAAPAAAQAPGPPAASGAVFQPLLADPKEPQFFAAYLWERSPHRSSARSPPRPGGARAGASAPTGRRPKTAAPWGPPGAAGNPHPEPPEA